MLLIVEHNPNGQFDCGLYDDLESYCTALTECNDGIAFDASIDECIAQYKKLSGLTTIQMIDFEMDAEAQKDFDDGELAYCQTAGRIAVKHFGFPASRVHV